MTTLQTPPWWYNPTHTYIVHGGWVQSRTDGQTHRVFAAEVTRLYGLRADLPNVVLVSNGQDAATHRLRQRSQSAASRTADPVMHIVSPQSSGDYSMPDDVRVYQTSENINIPETQEWLHRGGFLGGVPDLTIAPQSAEPDTKFVAKRNVLRVLSRPSRTVFGISVQVEADSTEVFVKPRPEGRE